MSLDPRSLLSNDRLGEIRFGGARMALLDIESGFWALRRQVEALAGQRLANAVLQQAGANGSASFARTFVGPQADVDGRQAFRDCVTAYQVAGFGHLEIESLEWPIGHATIRATNAFEAWVVRQRGQRARSPVCAYTAGVMVGFVNVVGGRRDIVCIESACQAQGAEHCRFELLPASEATDPAAVAFAPDPALSRHLNLLEILFDRMPMGIVLLDKEMRVRRFNPTWADFARRYGHVPSHQIAPGVSFFELAPGTEEQLLPVLSTVLAGETVSQQSFRLDVLDTTSYWDFVSSPLFEDGEVVGIVQVTTDATARVRAEESLRTSERHFRSLIENASDLITILDARGIIRYNSPSVERLLGYQPEELLGRQARDLIHPEDAPDIDAVLAEIAQHPESRTAGEFRLRHRDGSWRILESIGKSLLHDSAVAGIVVNSRDITERKNVEEALRASREELRTHRDHLEDLVSDRTSRLTETNRRLEREIAERRRTEDELRQERNFIAAVLDTAGALVVVLDREGRIVRFNRECERVTGYTAAEVLGRPFWEPFLIPEEEAAVKAVFREVTAGQFPNRKDNYWLTKTGDRRLISWTNTAILAADGSVKWVISTGVDVTERQRAEEALRDSEEKYRELVENANSIILRMDTAGNVTFFNEFAQKFFGYSEAEILGKNVVGTIVPSADGSGRDLANMILDMGRHAERYAVNENENVRRDGERVWVAWANKAIRDDQGNVVEILCVGNNITDRKMFEEALRRAHDEMEIRVVERTAELQQANESLREQIAERERVRKALTQRIAFENLITGISTSFINLAPDEVDQGISCALQAIGEFAEVDRSYVFLFSEDGAEIRNTHEWCAEGVESQRERFRRLPSHALPWLTERVRGLEVIHVRDVHDLPAEAAAEKEEQLGEGVRSFIVLPMVYRGAAMGFLGFDAVRSQKAWTEDSITLLKIVGELFVTALERKRVGEALHESQRAMSTLLSNLPGMAYRCRHDAERTMEFVSEGCLELTGYPPAELTVGGEVTYGGLIHPDDLVGLREEIDTALREGRPFREVYRIRTAAGEERWVWEQGRGVPSPEQGSVILEGFITDNTERMLAYQTLEQRVAERTRELSTLLEVSRNVASTLEVEPLLGLILDQLRSVLDYTGASILAVEERQLRVLAYRGPAPEGEVLRMSFPLVDLEPGAGHAGPPSPLIVADVWDDSPLARALRQSAGEHLTTSGLDYIRSWLGVPLVSRERVIGLLTLDHGRPGFYSERHAELAMTFANQAAVGIENARLYEEEQERRREAEQRREVAERLRDILGILNSNRPLGEILDYIVTQTCRLMGTEAAAIYRLQEDGQNLVIQAARGLPDDYVADMVMPIGHGAVGQAVLTRRPVTVEDVLTIPRLDELLNDPSRKEHLTKMASRHRALLAVPLIVKDEVYGGLVLYYPQPRAFSVEEIELAVTSSDQAALAIENARLRAQAEQSAVAAERSRLARDLHDAVTQTLFSASLIAEVLPRLWERNPDEGRRRLEELRQLTRGALAEMRTLLLELRPSALMEAALGDLLRQLGEATTGRARVPVDLTVEGQRNLPPDVQIALYRIAQEALNNVARHSAATRAEVVLHLQPTQVRLSVADDGRGFDPEQVPSDHLGLSIMRERADTIGARLTIEARPGRGARVEVVWRPLEPLPSESEGTGGGAGYQ